MSMMTATPINDTMVELFIYPDFQTKASYKVLVFGTV